MTTPRIVPSLRALALAALLCVPAAGSIAQNTKDTRYGYPGGGQGGVSSSTGPCSIASQRDATCTGSLNSNGTRPTDNTALSTDPRGANALRIPGVTMPPPASETNSCVTQAFVTWAYDPASYGTTTPSFVTTAGSGFLGAGSGSSPQGACASDSDGSCTTWVPASHPNLYLGNGVFETCSGSPTSGSLSCSARGGSAYVTTNASAGANFSAYMIACKTNSMPAGLKVLDAPLTWWSNCSGSSMCSFNYIFPPVDNTGAGA